jgi:16S rRNA (adenine1518-N6/adenine1519-N6)-dimethyltransferase
MSDNINKEASFNSIVNELIKNNGFSFKKKLGQNFIIDDNIIRSIVDKSNIKPNSLIIEVGPGAGALTRFLALKAKKVLSYEIDIKLKPILDKTLSEYKNVQVIYDDFLKRNIKKDIEESYDGIYLVANLPYYITTPIVTKIINDSIKVDEIIIMIQKEVGQRFMAIPKQKNYNSLSIFLDYYFEIKKLFDVSRNVFNPKPNVDSIVLSLKRREKTKVLVKDEELFFDLIRDSFKYKRKTIKNNLFNYNLDIIKEVLEKYNLDLNARGEEITIEQFAEIANNLKTFN